MDFVEFFGSPKIPVFCSRFVFTILAHQNFSPSKWKWNTLLKFVILQVFEITNFWTFCVLPIFTDRLTGGSPKCLPYGLYDYFWDCWDSPFLLKVCVLYINKRWSVPPSRTILSNDGYDCLQVFDAWIVCTFWVRHLFADMLNSIRSWTNLRLTFGLLLMDLIDNCVKCVSLQFLNKVWFSPID
jgi:hypothetical protein